MALPSAGMDGGVPVSPPPPMRWAFSSSSTQGAAPWREQGTQSGTAPYARAFQSHAVAAAETWGRRLEEERQSEIWKRERRDVVEVPGLRRRGEVILKQLDGLSQADRPKFL